MSDDLFLIVFVVGFSAFLVAAYFILRVVENKYRAQIDKARRIFAIFSVPVLIALIFAVNLYHDQMGYVCNESGDNTAGWTCTGSWLLVPLLLISISISAWYWVVYRKKIDPLDRAGK